MPWLLDSVETQLCLTAVSRRMIDAVIRDVVRARTEQYSQLEAAELIAAQRDERKHTEPMVDTTAAENDDEQQASFTLSYVICKLSRLQVAVFWRNTL